MSELIDGWLTTNQAAELTGYARVTIWRLARTGRIRARRIGRDWLIDPASLAEYQARMEALGARRFSPWRTELAAQGRGRKRQSGEGVL